jgi:D-alanyl-D-alanine carboxypeptidase (penicillin-binding protein 5/6)
VAAKAWLLYDNTSGQVLAGQGADERVEPASLTKLMTAYLVFAAVKQKTIALDQQVPVSDKAWKTGGSRMFIQPGRPVTVEELLHGVIVQSGNDACIALAELVAGSEATFVDMMNRQAQRLGLTGTQFTNVTGLTEPGHYSTPRDLVKLAAAIMRDFPEFYPIYAKKDYRYNNISQPNRNRLLWMDQSVDGMKTGHTDAAGYCLIASAKRGDRRLISAVLGTESEAARAQESLKLLNFGYQAYDAAKLYGAGQAVQELPVFKGASSTVKAGFPRDFVISLPKGAQARLKAELVSRQPLIAPIQQGQQVATLKLSVDGTAVGEYPVPALQAVPVAGFFGRLWDTVRLWLQ